MKKLKFFAILASVSVFLTYCSASKKAAKKKATYTANIASIMDAKCSPCHNPAKGGNKKPYNSYANVKADIDEIIKRIELNPTDRGFMPFKKTEKLPDEEIAIIKKWKADGMLEN
jgi:mono/diheme cytochrome c family protein